MQHIELWRKWREEAYARFKSDIEIGYVDTDIVDLIECVFQTDNYFTTSSCSGRIVVLDAMYPWLRDEAYIVFKKHTTIEVNEIESLIYTQRPLNRYWLISSGPIIHFVARSLEAAMELIKNVRSMGFKHSGIISLNPAGVVVEIISGTWTSFLLMDSEGLVVEPSALSRIVAIANEILLEGKRRLNNLKTYFCSLPRR
ncbi:MAG TPA: hypothetical protein EYP48_00625 [Ignisphaera sp.]|nr:hypothetical protein [Ignisphaera sp.]